MKKGFSKALAVFLALVMIVGLLPTFTLSANAASVFVPRTTAPSTSDNFYRHTSVGGLNSCIHISGGSVLPNCVGYAWGRAYEILGYAPRLSRGNARDWYGNTGDGYARGSTPRLGAISCWYHDGGGHVAVVEEIRADGLIRVSESSYGGARFNYGNWVVAPKPGDRLNYKNGYFQGYIYIGNFDSITKPAAPTSAALSPSNVGIGDTISASWASASSADSYLVQLICTSNGAYSVAEMEVSGTTTAYALNNAGTYKIAVRAKNSAGVSDAARESGTITVNANKTVTFRDHDGATLKTQSVKYGGSAAAPSAPSREGHTFQGWDKSFNSVTADLTVTATYQINSYMITFKGVDGSTLSTQQVNYGSAAAPPTPPAITNYTFVDWDTHEYEQVKRALIVTASYRWTNPDLPNTVQIVSAIRNTDATGYSVRVKLGNAPISNVNGRVIVALKTNSGKMVATETATYTLLQLASETKNIFVPYTGVAVTAEVSVVGLLADGNTGVPLAAKASAAVDLGLAWSDWSTAAPPTGSNIISESRAEYQYRDKATTSSSSPALGGWTLTGSAITSWTGWSGWQNGAVSASADRQVETQWIDAQYKTVHKYYHYKYWNTYYNKYYFTYAANGTRHEIALDYGLAPKKSYDGRQAFGSHDDGDGAIDLWWPIGTEQVQIAAGYTQYRYRTSIYTYYFEKWGDWSTWTAGNAPGATASKQVQTRTTYRYKSNSTDELQDNSGEARSVSGTIAAPGKLATLLVFRKTNADPTASQLEYVDQAMLGADGGYNFAFITKDEPSRATGDFEILLAVEGGSSPVYIDTIKAPLPEYTVMFSDEDGTELSRQTVKEGESAAEPQPPEKEGYAFVRWDGATTNIRNDVSVAAVYAKKTYKVVYGNKHNLENACLPTTYLYIL
jgi:surface antigen